MIRFIQEEVENFLAVVRKYMQLRGAMTQKDLAETVNVGISTMSRFLNQKTKDFDPQLIASIVANLNIPLHEIIEFIEEDSTITFKKLVEFYKTNQNADQESDMDGLEEELGGGAKQKFTANISTGSQSRAVPFGSDEGSDKLTMREKLNRLSPRQKGFITEFLDLDSDGRDLVVDVGSSLLSYFRQTRTNFDVN